MIRWLAMFVAYLVVGSAGVGTAFLLTRHWIRASRSQEASGVPKAQVPTATVPKAQVPVPGAPPPSDPFLAEPNESQESASKPPPPAAPESPAEGGAPANDGPPAPSGTSTQADSPPVDGAQGQPPVQTQTPEAAQGFPPSNIPPPPDLQPPSTASSLPTAQPPPPPPPPLPSASETGSGLGLSESPQDSLAGTLQSILEPFIYKADNRRDPFEPYREVRPVSPGEVVGPLLPLQRFDLDEIKLIGIIWNVRNPRAMFLDPNQRIHILSKDDRIGRSNGYIAVIREGEVVVVETVSIRGELGYSTRVLRITR